MDGVNWPRNIVDGSATISAVWLALTLAGIAAGMVASLPPWDAAAPILSLLLYAALLAAYGHWTQPGRRSAGAYFIAGFFYPIAFVAALILIFRLTDHPAENIFLLLDGANVGFQAHGGPDMPLEAYLPLMYLNILLPIAVVIGVRSFVRYHRED